MDVKTVLMDFSLTFIYIFNIVYPGSGCRNSNLTSLTTGGKKINK